MASRGSVDTSGSALQRKIFGRYVRQKLFKRNIDVKDIVEDAKDGFVLLALLEVLSEKKYDGKTLKESKQRVQQIDNVNNILAFCWKAGVELKLKPSAENIVDGDERSILGLVWAIMLKFMKIGDDEDSLNAKDALLLWAKNKTAGYKGIELKSYKDFNNGLALSAIIHKHRPSLIPYDSLVASEGLKNLEVAQDAALKYFDLEKYIKPEEIQKLDENSMVVYVSEYYYGIAEQRKLDLATRRLAKVIKLTVENDALKKQFAEKAVALRDLMKSQEKILEDRTIDNTLEGAKRRIGLFYEYKSGAKGKIIEGQLETESIFNNLSLRLSLNKRPEFVPPQGCSLRDVAKSLAHLELCEQERSVALHAELNRQMLLVELDKQHTDRYSKLAAWIDIKDAYVKKKEEISSVSQAQLQLRLLDAFDKEEQALNSGSVKQLTDLGDYLANEKFEFIGRVKENDESVTASFVSLRKLSALKRPVLDDDLVREIFKDKVRLWNKNHVALDELLHSWIKDKEAYLNVKELIESVHEARTQLSLLESYEEDKAGQTESNVARLKKIGADIVSAKHSSSYSSWVFEDRESVTNRETTIDQKWTLLSDLSTSKKAVLEDDLAREIFKEKVRLWNKNQLSQFNQLSSWVREKETYLKHKETIESISDAQTQLSLLESYVAERSGLGEKSLARLKKLGDEILAAKYETQISSWVFENPEEITGRHNTLDSDFSNLLVLSNQKHEVLKADLAREQEKERLRLEFAHLATEFVRWTKDEASNISNTHFGFTLEEVQAYQAKLEEKNSARDTQTEKLKSEYTQVKSAMDSLLVTHNIYTVLTIADLQQAETSMSKSVSENNDRYHKELQRQLANDALCRLFASQADPFSKMINDVKEKVTLSQADLQGQLNFVEEKLKSLESDGSPLNQINDTSAKMDEAGILTNKHTTLTAKDVQLQWQQYKLFLERKKVMLEEEVEREKLKGVTPEQFKEIESNFRQFDTANSGFLDRKAFKACLYSLGEEKTNAEIDGLMKEYGDGSKVPYEGYKGFMVQLLGVSDSKLDILAGFELMCRHNSVAKKERLDLVGMAEKDVSYFTQTAPKLEDGWDFKAWTEDVFAR